MYKRLFIIAAATAVLSSSAIAADLRGGYSETPHPYGGLPFAPAPASFDWTGLYAGVNVGYGGGGEQYDYDVVNLGIGGYDTQRNNGIVGGGQIGYNYAIYNSFIAGVEADFDGTSIAGSAVLDQPAIYARLSSRMDYFGTVRGRLGYAFDRVMLYATGGFAYANMTTNVYAPNNGINDQVSHFHVGYAVGGGFEYAVTNNITLRAEYLRLAYDVKLGGGNDPWQMYHLQERPTENIVRAGVNYKLDFFAPVAPLRPVIARY